MCLPEVHSRYSILDKVVSLQEYILLLHNINHVKNTSAHCHQIMIFFLV